MFGKKTTNKRIYLDNSASSSVDMRVVEAMNPYWSEHYGNAGSIHKEGRTAKDAIESARSIVAKALHAQAGQIIFTSGGTESNNLAIFGTLKKIQENTKGEKVNILTSEVEHKSILDTYSATKAEGVDTVVLPTDGEGRVNLDSLKTNMTDSTVLVSLIYVNNEIGTIQDIKSISRIIRKHRKESGDIFPLFHVDASQAPAWLNIDTEKLGVDLLTLDGQKVYGPKGVGCLYVRNKEHISPILYGGGQEDGLRPGTPPTPLIVGFARALEILEEERGTYVNNIREMRDWFIDNIEKELPDVQINGPRDESRIAGNISMSFSGVEGEHIVIEMDEKGIAISTGSACLADESGGSHVIKALHKDEEKEDGTIRLSLGRRNTMNEVKETAEKLVETVKWLQAEH